MPIPAMSLPPLNAIRAFEAAGRLENFSKAAAELNVTPGAISRQIKNLELHLGIALFARIGNEVRITAAGRLYLGYVNEAFAKLDSGTRAISVDRGSQPLHIWGSRFFIRLWLLPRLPDFHLQFPDQEVLITTVRPDEPLPSEFDVAIMLGKGDWNSMHTELLLRRVLMPVASPSYLKSAPPLRTPADLEGHTLLETSAGLDQWDLWSRHAGAGSLALARRITFTSTDLAFSAALDGLGIVLGRRGFVENDLRKGNLIKPFEHTVDAGDGFYLITPDRPRVPAKVRQFKRWITGQLAAEQA
jgi:LysR family transcriptional regulator, glycine cleavage system transcriptional activator